jgi:hypothetical protein
MLCLEVCKKADIWEKQTFRLSTTVSFEDVNSEVWERLGLTFKKRCERFCRGTKMKSVGRAPYLHILKWLAEQGEWTLDLRAAIRLNKEMSGSVSQVVKKGYLKDLVTQDSEVAQVLHFDENSEQLTVEDPLFVFYIRNMPWSALARGCGFVSVDFRHRYDFALSFAGQQRHLAEKLFVSLSENEVEVFYDRNEQHRILAEDIENYLRPIYQSEAHFVIPLLSNDYPERVWTQIESAAFRERFGENSVIPVWFSDAAPGMFDESRRYGGVTLDVNGDLDGQIRRIAGLALRKLEEEREEAA